MQANNTSQINAANDIQLPDHNTNGTALPKLKCDGTYDKCFFFRDTFRCTIHDSTTINKVQKFHYLRFALIGEACEVINSLKISAVNYNLA